MRKAKRDLQGLKYWGFGRKRDQTSEVCNPNRDDEHPSLFHMGAPPTPRANYSSCKTLIFSHHFRVTSAHFISDRLKHTRNVTFRRNASTDLRITDFSVFAKEIRTKIKKCVTYFKRDKTIHSTQIKKAPVSEWEKELKVRLEMRVLNNYAGFGQTQLCWRSQKDDSEIRLIMQLSTI